VLLTTVVISFAVSKCQRPEPPPEYVARVGDQYLYKDDVLNAMANIPSISDSAEVRQQIVELWLRNELLALEAERRGLRNEPAVQRLLKDNERSVLVSAVIEQLYAENLEEPSHDDVQNYFELNQQQMRLLEPFVRVRYLAAEDPEKAEEARDALTAAMQSGTADSLWAEIVEAYAVDREASMALSTNYFPQSRVLGAIDPVWRTVTSLQPERIAPIIAAGDQYHLVQVVDRVPEGTVPRREWIEEEIRQRLIIQARKQMYLRQVQRLRNEALAQETLEIR
jgi:hypothetical protein